VNQLVNNNLIIPLADLILVITYLDCVRVNRVGLKALEKVAFDEVYRLVYNLKPYDYNKDGIYFTVYIPIVRFPLLSNTAEPILLVRDHHRTL
jgi:hypothetical protein